MSFLVTWKFGQNPKSQPNGKKKKRFCYSNKIKDSKRNFIIATKRTLQQPNILSLNIFLLSHFFFEKMFLLSATFFFIFFIAHV